LFTKAGIYNSTAFTLLLMLAAIYLFVGLALVVDAVRRVRRSEKSNRPADKESALKSLERTSGNSLPGQTFHG